MPQTLKEVMTPSPTCLAPTETLARAAQVMRDQDVGDVIVCTKDTISGIVTDRDIVVRAVAAGRDPAAMKLGDVASRDVVTLSPDDSIDRAVQLMREKAVRRLPVCEKGGKPVGVVSIGDLALERDGASVLADISAAPGNR